MVLPAKQLVLLKHARQKLKTYFCTKLARLNIKCQKAKAQIY